MQNHVIVRSNGPVKWPLPGRVLINPLQNSEPLVKIRLDYHSASTPTIGGGPWTSAILMSVSWTAFAVKLECLKLSEYLYYYGHDLFIWAKIIG